MVKCRVMNSLFCNVKSSIYLKLVFRNLYILLFDIIDKSKNIERHAREYIWKQYTFFILRGMQLYFKTDSHVLLKELVMMISFIFQFPCWDSGYAVWFVLCTCWRSCEWEHGHNRSRVCFSLFRSWRSYFPCLHSQVS